MASKYKTRRISWAEIDDNIRVRPGWEWICDNNTGTCYWNTLTGELLWVDEDEENSKISELIKE